MKTMLFGVIGHPIAHSLSPLMHNRVFEEMHLPCAYSAFDVAPDSLRDFLLNCKAGGFSGLNVTIPHKQEVLQYLDFIDETAKKIGAVNTIKIDMDSTSELKGYNTDGVGALKALKCAGESIKRQKVLIIGAGGAARAIGFQLALEGAEVMISNRTTTHAISLAKDIRAKTGKRLVVLEFSEKSLLEIKDLTDIVVNTTPIGMHPKTEQSPVPQRFLRKDMTVMDIVYNPLKTTLLRDAQKTGCKTIDGVEMLAEQGAESLRIWMGIDPPVKLMKEEVRKRLSLP